MRNLKASLQLTRLTLSGIFLSGGLCVAALAQGPDEIVWLDEAKTQAYLIPESAFAKLDWSEPAKTDLSGLGMTKEEQEWLRSAVLEKLSSSLPFECDPAAVGSTVPGPLALAKSLPDFIRADSVNFAAVGRIVRRVPTWAPGSYYPMTRVFVKVEEPLRQPPSGKVEAGTELAFLEYFGDLMIGPARFCIEPEEDWRTRPAFSHGLLVARTDFGRSPQHLWVGLFLRISNGQVLWRQRSGTVPWETYPLGELSEELDTRNEKG